MKNSTKIRNRLHCSYLQDKKDVLFDLFPGWVPINIVYENSISA